MKVIQLAATADADGVLRLTIPVGGPGCEYDLAVVVSVKPPTANGTGATKPKTPEELGWPPGFFENTFGSIDDERFVRPPQPTLDPVEPIE